MKLSRIARRAAGGAVAAVALVLAGCSPSVGTVSGVVTLNGQPVPNAAVSIVAADGQILSDMTNPSGEYSIPNVPAGPATVTIQPAAEKSLAAQQDIKKGKIGAAPAPTAGKQTINPKYGDSTKSGLTLTVKSGMNKFDIPLEP